MSSCHARGDDSFGDPRCDRAFDDGRHRIHGSNDLGLELRRDVQLDLLKEILGRAKSTDYQHILGI